MSAGQLTKEVLAEILRETRKAHAESEKKLGRPDANWPAWYAEYIINKLQEKK